MSFPTFVSHQLLHSATRVTEPATRAIGQTINMVAGNEVPGVEQLIHLGLTGWVDPVTIQYALLYHGVPTTVAGNIPTGLGLGAKQWMIDIWNQYYWSQQEIGTVDQQFVLANRGLINTPTLDSRLERLGVYSETIRAQLANLRFEIPSSSDLVRFSVRHVFEPDLIAHFGYNDEFRPILDMWHRFQGLNYPIFSGPFGKQVAGFEAEHGLPVGSFLQSYVDLGLADPTWAQAFWWSHWVLPSAGQGYEMLFRLRPERDRRFDPPFARGLEFTLEDLGLLLRANDYPPFYRPFLAAIAYRIPGIRFLRQLYSTGVFAQGDVVELLLRQGYSPGDAQVLSESVARNDREAKRKQIEAKARGKVADYWELGIITDADYRGLLTASGLSPEEATEVLDLANVDYRYKRVGKVVAYVRRQFTRGSLDPQTARIRLQQAGIVEPRVVDYLADWGLEVQAKGKEIPAAKAVRWACAGIISVADLRGRLVNLGYPPDDVDGMTVEAQQCANERVVRAAAAAARAEKARNRDLIAAQRAAANVIKSSRQALSKHGSPTQLRKWFCEGHIGQAELYQRLGFLGWPDADIARLIGDCQAGAGSGRGGARGP